MGIDGIIHVKVIEGSFNGESFKEFLGELLERMNQFPGPKSVLGTDNCKIHKVPGVREMIQKR